MVVWITFTEHFLWVSFGQSFWFAWFWGRIWYIPGSSHVRVCISQPRWIIVKRPMGSLASLPFWPLRSFIVGRVSLTSRMRNLWSLISYLGRAYLLLPPTVMELLSTGNKLQWLTLKTIYLLPQHDHRIEVVECNKEVTDMGRAKYLRTLQIPTNSKWSWTDREPLFNLYFSECVEHQHFNKIKTKYTGKI